MMENVIPGRVDWDVVKPQAIALVSSATAGLPQRMVVDRPNRHIKRSFPHESQHSESGTEKNTS